MRTVEVFEAAADGIRFGEEDILATPLLPGFTLRLSELFAALD